MKRQLNRSRKALLAIAAGVMLAAGAAFLGAHGDSHDAGQTSSAGACAYACSQIGHGYSWCSSSGECTCL